jgi:hypothetical protein
MKHRAAVACAALLLIAGAAYVIMAFNLQGTCENSVDHMLRADDGMHDLVLLHRDCGATTSVTSQVAVVPVNGASEIEDTSVAFVSDEGQTQIHWRGNRAVEISYSRDVKVFRQKAAIGNVSIRYVLK